MGGNQTVNFTSYKFFKNTFLLKTSGRLLEVFVPSWILHWTKSVQIRSFFWSIVSCVWTEYEKIWSRKNFVFCHKTLTHLFTAYKMKSTITSFFSKCDQILRKVRSWSHLLKKSLMENYIFVQCFLMLNFYFSWKYKKILWFSDAFRRNKNETLARYGLREASLKIFFWQVSCRYLKPNINLLEF